MPRNNESKNNTIKLTNKIVKINAVNLNMGNANSAKNNILMPELYYVLRKKATILHIYEGEIAKLKFSKRLRIRSDSAIGYLPNRKLMICGGTDSAGCFINKVFIIDPIKLKSKLVSILPVPSKLGLLIEYRD